MLASFIKIQKYNNTDRRLCIDPTLYNNQQVILRCQPIALALNKSKRTQICVNCLKKAEEKCSSCKFHYYCSKQCQLLDWQQFHKNECKFLLLFQDKYQQLPNNLALIIRLMVNSIGLEDFFYKEDLIDDIKLKQYQEIALIISKTYGKYKNIEENQEQFVENINKIIVYQAKIQFNAFTIMDLVNGEAFGVGLYTPANFIDHRCNFIQNMNQEHIDCANTFVSFSGKELLICTNDIFQRQLMQYEKQKSENKLLEINISYNGEVENDPENFLEQQYGFRCACSRCIFEQKNKKQSLLIKLKDKKVNEEELNQKLNLLIKNQKLETLKELSKIVELYIDIRFKKPLEWIYFDLLQQQNYKEAFYVLEKIIKSKFTVLIFQKDLPYWLNTGDHPLIGWRMNEAAKLGFHLDLLIVAEEYGEKSLIILRKFYFNNEEKLKELKQRLQDIKNEIKMVK